MQPTELQVQRSLEALLAAPRPPEDLEPLTREPRDGEQGGDEVPVEILEWIGSEPVLRLDRLDEVRSRLQAGEEPSADDLARRMVGRLVCDRLR